MQLRSVQVKDKGFDTSVQMAAPLHQWIELCGLTTEEFMELFSGDIFRFVKWMNERIKGDVTSNTETSE